jgi:hypothetical protein
VVHDAVTCGELSWCCVMVVVVVFVVVVVVDGFALCCFFAFLQRRDTMTIFCVAGHSSLGVAVVPGCLRRPHSRFYTESLLGENFSIRARTRQYYGYAIFGGRQTHGTPYTATRRIQAKYCGARVPASTISRQGCVAFFRSPKARHRTYTSTLLQYSGVL